MPWPNDMFLVLAKRQRVETNDLFLGWYLRQLPLYGCLPRVQLLQLALQFAVPMTPTASAISERS